MLRSSSVPKKKLGGVGHYKVEFCTIVLVLAPSTRHHLVLAPCTTFNSVPFFFGAGTKKVEHAPGSE